MAAIDGTARVADGAHLGDGVEIGPYCLVGPQVKLKDGVRLIAHVNIAGATTVGEGTVVYPFASLGTPPQSVHSVPSNRESPETSAWKRCLGSDGLTMPR